MLTPRWGAVLVLSSLAIACEVKNALDSKKVEENIRTELEKQIGMKAKSVDCPKTVFSREKKGEKFQCEATAEDGRVLKIEVTMEGEGKVRWKSLTDSSSKPSSAPPPQANVLNTKNIEGLIARELEKQTGIKPKSVTCPEDVTEKTGETFNCTATADDDSQAPIEVTMKGDGKISWKTVGQPPAPPPQAPPPEPPPELPTE